MKYIYTFIFIFFTTGCWNYRELNNSAIVTSLAIDYIGSEYQIAALIANGKKISDNTSQAGIVYGYGDTIDKALADIELTSPKEISIKHLSLVIISEDIAIRGISDIVDYLLSDQQLGQNFYLIVAKDSLAIDILTVSSPLAEYSSRSIVDNLKSSKFADDSSFKKFIKKYLDINTNPSVTGATVIQSLWYDYETEEVVLPSEYIKLNYKAIFKGDKLDRWIND